MKIRTCLAILLCSITVTSCLLFKTSFEINSWSPGAESPANPETAVISVHFNNSPDTILTEEAFSISCSNEEVPGRVNWQDDILIFVPYMNLHENSEYTLQIDSSAEDKNGRSLSEDFIVSFRTGDIDGRPAVTTTTPADASFINSRRTDIVISFDRPMDFDSLLSAFSITPELRGVSTIDSIKKVFTFSPVEDFELQEEYSVELSIETASISGYRLAEEYQFTFIISDDTYPPEISWASSGDEAVVLSEYLVNTGWEKDGAVRLHFTEELHRQSAEASITIDPPASFDINFDESTTPADMLINFTENLEWHTLYSLSVSTAVKDLAGNNMEREQIYKLFIDGESSAPPILSKADFVSQGSAVCFFDSLTPTAAIDSHRILDTSGGDATQNPFYFDFYFSLAEGAQLPFFEFTENFLISPADSCITVNYLDFQLYNPGSSTASADAPQPTPTTDQAVLRLITAVTDSRTQSNSIMFRVYSDLTDSLGNSMTKDWNWELFDEDN